MIEQRVLDKRGVTLFDAALKSSGTSNTVFRYGRAGKSGRPRLALSEQRRKARERARAYRDRQKTPVA